LGQLAGLFRGTAAARRRRAITTLVGIVGALTLARAVEDPVLSDEIFIDGAAGLRKRLAGVVTVFGRALWLTYGRASRATFHSTEVLFVFLQLDHHEQRRFVNPGTG